MKGQSWLSSFVGGNHVGAVPSGDSTGTWQPTKLRGGQATWPKLWHQTWEPVALLGLHRSDCAQELLCPVLRVTLGESLNHRLNPEDGQCSDAFCDCVVGGAGKCSAGRKGDLGVGRGISIVFKYLWAVVWEGDVIEGSSWSRFYTGYLIYSSSVFWGACYYYHQYMMK